MTQTKMSLLGSAAIALIAPALVTTLASPSHAAAPSAVGTLTQISPPTASPAAPAADRKIKDPLVIGHRGASGYRPEHTLASYKLAIRLGADYIEPDLVSTKDGVLVARHENEIGSTTNVADHPEFAHLRTTKTIDGRPITGWFTEDFTYAQLRTLRAKERLPEVRPQNTAYDGRFQIPRFDEVIELAKKASKETGRTIGIYPETKHPTYFDSIGLSLEEPLVRTLKRHHIDRKSAAVIIQSFETGNLRDLDRMTKVDLAQLVDASGAPFDLVASGDPRTYRDLVTPSGLRWVAKYADGVGAHKRLVLPTDASGATGAPSQVVPDAHRAGLKVHVWSVRDENQFLPTNFRRGTDPNAHGDSEGEALALYRAGVDGIFADQPDTAYDAREIYLSE